MAAKKGDSLKGAKEPKFAISGSNPYAIFLLQGYKSKLEGGGHTAEAKECEAFMREVSNWQKANPDKVKIGE